MESARQSADFAARAGTTNVNATVLEQLDADLESIARRYLTQPLVPLLADMIRVRNKAWELLEGRQHPAQTRHLYIAAGKACGLLASASNDLGQYDAADTHARTASLCADLAGHDKLRAWVANTRSVVAFWRGQPQRAAEYAERAAHFAGQGIERVRAHAYGARARARLGDAPGARAEIAAGVRARHEADDAHDYIGMFAFPLANQQRCAGSALVWLGEPEDGIIHLDDALTGYGREDSYAHVAVTQLDLVRARLHLGDLDGARTTIAPVLALPEELRLAGVSRRTAGIQRLLTGPAFDRRPAALALAEQVEDFLERNAARALPGPHA
ncbi:hypothetical protein LO772_29560 [Yinghuangia sp. ASG 101]|uniref:hypothetical protein n=1 Tax=Yinghuangia sp. ASG 101 TaxID=2896848 RepID=UPI001E5BA272|nr:hypothetical protein [Yinghuangia sp. ASG 101]UGQ10919.1 hypothetical protein LO772_29560 [Yinghuangia sp. ASG 101]